MSLINQLMVVVLAAEMVLVLLICLPLPSNNVRGFIIRGYKMLWANEHVKLFFKVVTGLNAILWLDAMRRIFQLEERHEKFVGSVGDGDVKMHLFANQRNAWISGFSLFLIIVIYRLLVLMEQLHDSRRQLKAFQEGQAAAAAVPLRAEEKKNQ